MKNILCSGVSTFLYICASEVLPSNMPIKVIFSLEKNSKREFKDIDLKKKFIQDIAFFFNKTVIFENLSDQRINNDDIVSSNLIRFLLPRLKGQRLNIFPEGVSCFNSLLKKDANERVYAKLKKYIKKVFVGHYNINKKWILPDIENRINTIQYADSSNLIIPKDIFFNNIKKCSEYFFEKYQELEMYRLKEAIFHPLSEHIDLNHYKEWVEKFKDVVGKKKLLIKCHENDYRNFKNIFQDFNYFEIDKKFTVLPAELITCNLDVKYLGYYSSLMLFFKKKDIFFFSPPDKNHINIAKREYSGLRHILNI